MTFILNLPLFLAPVQAETVNLLNNNSASALTLTCTLSGVAQHDGIYIGFSGTKTVSTVSDSVGNTYLSQAAQAGTNASAYIYAANATTAPNRGVLLTITVTFSSSAQSVGFCYDTAGFVAGHAAHTSTGSGTFSSGNSFSPSVASYQPTSGNLEISVFGGSTCGSPATITTPANESTGNSKITTGNSVGTACRTSPSTNFIFIGASAYRLSAQGTHQTDPYTATGTQTINEHRAQWAEVAADFTAKTVKSQSVSETNTLGVDARLRQRLNTQTNTLGVFRQLAQKINTEVVGLLIARAPAQYIGVQQVCLGVATTVNSVPTLNTGPVCTGTGNPVIVTNTVACNFFQLQCWWYPMFFLGTYTAFLVVPVAVRGGSEKAVIYSLLAGATFCSWIEVIMGIMTPMLPVMLVAANIVYSFNLLGRVAAKI